MLLVRPSSADATQGAQGHRQQFLPCRDSTNSIERSWMRAQSKVIQRAGSAGTSCRLPRGGPRVAVQAAQAASGETAAFLGFVELLAAKPAVEAQQLLQLAALEARKRQSVASVAHSHAFGSGATLRRASSAEDLNRAYGRAAKPAVLGQLRQLPGRVVRAGGMLVDGWDELDSGPYYPPPLQPIRPVPCLADAASEVRARLYFDEAATVLQAGWRGRTHRRICRYYRARGARHRRLRWMADCEEVTLFIRWAGAATTIQAAYRGKTGRRGHPPQPVPSAAVCRHARGADAAGARAADAPGRRRGLRWADDIPGGSLCDVKRFEVEAGKGAWPEPRHYGE